jgi:hypothetical protein
MMDATSGAGTDYPSGAHEFLRKIITTILCKKKCAFNIPRFRIILKSEIILFLSYVSSVNRLFLPLFNPLFHLFLGFVRYSICSSGSSVIPAFAVTFTGACANEIIPSINRSFVYKAKEGCTCHVRIYIK